MTAIKAASEARERAAGLSSRTSADRNSGAPHTHHSTNCRACWSSVKAGSPTNSWSGSCQWPGPGAAAKAGSAAAAAHQPAMAATDAKVVSTSLQLRHSADHAAGTKLRHLKAGEKRGIRGDAERDALVNRGEVRRAGVALQRHARAGEVMVHAFQPARHMLVDVAGCQHAALAAVAGVCKTLGVKRDQSSIGSPNSRA